MLAQKTVQHSMRRFAAQPQTFSISALYRFAAPSAISSRDQYVQIRPVATQKMDPDSAYQILVKQRQSRPVSPHLSIYRPQITWCLSGLNRITGCVMSGGLYIFATAYLAAPLLGWHLESQSLAAAFGAWPVAAKVATKFTVALPFTFHCLNGIRHLTWDTGAEFGNKQVQRSGWVVVGATVVGSGILAYM